MSYLRTINLVALLFICIMKQSHAEGSMFNTIQAKGTTIYEWSPESPSSKNVLLLHGFPQDGTSWALIAQYLAVRGYRVVSYDQRGSTPSTSYHDASSYNFSTFVEDALQVADNVEFERFHVVGFGWGGALAWMIAAYHPDRVDTLTTLRYPHPAAFIEGITDDPEQKRSWKEVRDEIGPENIDNKVRTFLADDSAELTRFLQKSGLPEPQLTTYVDRLQQPGVLKAGLSWGLALDEELFRSVPNVTVPVLYIWSEGPAVARQAVVLSEARCDSDFTVREVEGAGHFMMETQPRSVAEILDSFLSLTHM